MKRIKTILILVLMVLATFAISATAGTVLMKAQQKKVTNNVSQQSFFDAEITFYIYEGTGCGCKPLIGATINATSGDGEDSGVTDENGTCVLHMVINSDYRVSIEAQDYNTVMFDFNVVDDQNFRFHMGEKNDDSSHSTPNLLRLVTRLLNR